MINTIANATTTEAVKALMPKEELQFLIDDDVTVIVSARIDQVFGKDNTYGVEQWEGFEIEFMNDDGRTITVNERTLEVYEYL